MYTILGGQGFIGRHLATFLESQGVSVWVPSRAMVDAPGFPDQHLGRVIYCIGRTADFRQRLQETMAAHTAPLLKVLASEAFDSLVYLSSTRVYGARGTGREEDPVQVNPNDPSDLYNISKLAGESLCLTYPNAAGRVARLANVFGAGMPGDIFLPQVARAALRGHVRFASAAASAKDYLAIDDAVRALACIATQGRHRLYNVASGSAVSNAALGAALNRLTGCAINYVDAAPTLRFPDIAIDRLLDDFDAPLGGAPAPLVDARGEAPALEAFLATLHAQDAPQ